MTRKYKIKERGIKSQFIDMNEKELSKDEFCSVSQVVSGISTMINENRKDKDALALVQYIVDDEKEENFLPSSGLRAVTKQKRNEFISLHLRISLILCFWYKISGFLFMEMYMPK